jgi:hypothetical protein
VEGLHRRPEGGKFKCPLATEYYVTMHRNDANFDAPSNSFLHWTEPSTVPSQVQSPPQSPVPSQIRQVPNTEQRAIKLQELSRLGYSKGPPEPIPCTQYGTHIHSTMGDASAALRSAPVGSAIASEAARHSVATPKLKTIETAPEPSIINDGRHAARAFADLNARRVATAANNRNDRGDA